MGEEDPADRHLALRQRAGLIGSNHRDAAESIHRRQASHLRVPARHTLHIDRQRDCDDGWQFQIREIPLPFVGVRGRQAAPEIYISCAVPGIAGHRTRKSKRSNGVWYNTSSSILKLIGSTRRASKARCVDNPSSAVVRSFQQHAVERSTMVLPGMNLALPRACFSTHALPRMDRLGIPKRPQLLTRKERS